VSVHLSFCDDKFSKQGQSAKESRQELSEWKITYGNCRNLYKLIYLYKILYFILSRCIKIFGIQFLTELFLRKSFNGFLSK